MVLKDLLQLVPGAKVARRKEPVGHVGAGGEGTDDDRDSCQHIEVF